MDNAWKNSFAPVGLKSFLNLIASLTKSEMFEPGMVSPSIFTCPVLSHVIILGFAFAFFATTHEVVKKGENSQAQSLLDEINDWSIANKFQLRPQKCKELRISFTRDDVSHDDVLIDQSTLNIVESVRILGVTIQNNLKWNLHIKDTVKKASKRLYFLKQLKRAKLSTEELVKFYVTCIQSVIIFRTQKFRYNNALFHIKRSTQLMKGLGSNLCRKIK